MEAWKAELYANELYHHGVLGQRWGVRRYQNPDGTRTALGKRRLSKKINKSLDKPIKLSKNDKIKSRIIAEHNEMARRELTAAKKLIDTPEYKAYKNSEEFKNLDLENKRNAYTMEYHKRFNEGREEYYKKHGEPKNIDEMEIMAGDSDEYGSKFAYDYFRNNPNGQKIMNSFTDAQGIHNKRVNEFVDNLLTDVDENRRRKLAGHIIADEALLNGEYYKALTRES